MNLTEAINAALPELPVHAAKLKRVPKLDPNLIVREHIQDGEPMVYVLIPGVGEYYPLTPDHWSLMQLFDGQRSYAEIAQLYSLQRNVTYPEQYVREVAEDLVDSPFCYKSPQERNIALIEKLTEERH